MPTPPLTLLLNQRGLDVNLPPPAPREAAVPRPQIVVEYASDKRLSINTQPVALGDLGDRLRQLYEDRTDKTMYVMGAGSLRYGDIVSVIDAAKVPA